MKLKREARLLKDKALASLRRAAGAFNEFDDVGRTSTVLLHTQHAFEMLLKAALVQNGVKVFDKRDGRAIGFEKCLNLGREHLNLSDDNAGTMRAVDALRDDEQHWITECSEGLLYMHVRASVTLFDDMLQTYFDDRLTNHWPHRVLPISAEPPQDIQTLIDEEFTAIRQLLSPGTRRRPDARARIRSLLALEAHVAEGVIVSKRDVDRIERAVRKGGKRHEVFPELAKLRTDVAGDGVTVTVRIWVCCTCRCHLICGAVDAARRDRRHPRCDGGTSERSICSRRRLRLVSGSRAGESAHPPPAMSLPTLTSRQVR